MSRSTRARFETCLEGSLPGGWEDEVKEILDRAEALEKKTGRRKPIALPRAHGRRINPLVAMGEFIGKRLATARDMATTGIVIIFAALLLVVVPGGRYFSPVLALSGIALLAVAYILTLKANRTGGGGSTGPKVWRGRVVSEDEPTADEGFFRRLFNRGDRDS